MVNRASTPHALSARDRLLTILAFVAFGIAWMVLGHLIVRPLPPEVQPRAILIRQLLWVAVTTLTLYVALYLGRRRERALEGELQSALQGMADAVVVVDRNGQVSRANAAALQWVQNAELLRGPAAALLASLRTQWPEGRAATWTGEVLQTILSGGTHPPEELELRDRDGRHAILQLSFSPVRHGPDQRPYAMVVVGRDITELKRLERLRDQFLATAAHELKTPAAAMKGYAQLLERWTPGGHNPREGRAFQVLIRQGERLGRLTDELLAVSRLQLGRMRVNPKRERLDVLLGEWIDSLRALSPLHTLRYIPPEQPVWARADAGRLEHVVANLIDNAIKYSPAGGDVEIRLGVDGEEVRLEIRDWGMGIPADRQEGIFELYQRAHAGLDEDPGGLGVGLYVSRALVEQMRGRIGFESEEGEGSTFWLTLPHAPVPAEEVDHDATIGAPG